MKPKTAILVGTPNEIVALLAKIAPGYPDLRWCDNDALDDPNALNRYGSDETQLLELSAGKPLALLSDQPIRNATLASSRRAAAEFIRVYGPPESRVVRIDRNWLRKNGACADGTKWFADTFGATASVSSDAVLKLIPEDHPAWGSWFRARLITNPAD